MSESPRLFSHRLTRSQNKHSHRSLPEIHTSPETLDRTPGGAPGRSEKNETRGVYRLDDTRCDNTRFRASSCLSYIPIIQEICFLSESAFFALSLRSLRRVNTERSSNLKGSIGPCLRDRRVALIVCRFVHREATGGLPLELSSSHRPSRAERAEQIQEGH